MRRLFKILLIVILLAWGALGLRHAQGSLVPHEADEIFDTGAVTAPVPSRIAWVAEQTVTWVNDSEIEE
ncbi:MAG TPA: hypothetical protein VJT74_05900 [Pyrinomonadaceae bacterium]|nr:hypothetical protein [Pyrinomonadaceae bacterium]